MYFISMRCLPICKLVCLTYLKKLIFDIKMEMHASFVTVILSGKSAVLVCLYSCDTLSLGVSSKQTLWTVQPAQPAAAGLCCGSHELSTASGSVWAGTGLLSGSALSTSHISLRGK